MMSESKEDTWYADWEYMYALQDRGAKEAWVNRCVYNVILQMRKLNLLKKEGENVEA
jgi:hypothetical protein